MCSAARKRRVFSGIQPSGDAPHLGNYLGALSQWVARQSDSKYDKVIYSVVDLHALTADGRAADMRQRSRFGQGRGVGRPAASV